MEMIDIVMNLNGPITATGEHNEDEKRLANLERLMELSDNILHEIDQASHSSRNHQASMKAIGQKAYGYMSDLGMK